MCDFLNPQLITGYPNAEIQYSLRNQTNTQSYIAPLFRQGSNLHQSLVGGPRQFSGRAARAWIVRGWHKCLRSLILKSPTTANQQGLRDWAFWVCLHPKPQTRIPILEKPLRSLPEAPFSRHQARAAGVRFPRCSQCSKSFLGGLGV